MSEPDGWEVDLNARLEARIAALEAVLAERETTFDKSARGYVREVAFQMERAERAEAELAKFKSHHQGGGCGTGATPDERPMSSHR